MSLRAIYDDVISKIKHEGRDFKPFAIHEQIISFYLNSGKEELICPIIFMDGRKKGHHPKIKKILEEFKLLRVR